MIAPHPMRFRLLAATAALAAGFTTATAATPAAGQTITIPPSASGAEVGPFGADASYGFTTALIGQSFLSPGAVLQSFTFYLRNEAGATAVPQFRAYVADWDPLNSTVGAVRFTSGLLVGQGSAGFQPLTVAADAGLTAGLPYVVYLSGITSTRGVNYLAANDGAPYAGGALVYDLGGGSLYADAAQEAAFTAVFAPAATAVPEPATVLLVAGGLVGVGALARRRRAA